MTSLSPSPSPSPNEKLAAGFDTLSIVAEATAGYKQKLITGGITPETAETMAVEYHRVLLEVMRDSIMAGFRASAAAASRAASPGQR